MELNTIVRTFVIATAGLSLAACTVTPGLDAARVDCGTPGPQGVECQIQRTGGSGGFEACWDLVITCQNGGEMTGSACHAMAAGESQGSDNMPVADFSNQDRCDIPVSGRVEGLKISAR